ncbi:hypothetical protein DFH08DRAFT_804139 [Mycena albidolilacea]|uniref:Uncharacterized protein n=1 Tax=Mycena albidolilacea TaxID=1033008 RepID=A0AAD7ABC7_9AGAR|nr:hypothetical protein DFH08DRAFT_804139 [Mycena albidolilacea]
MDRNPPPPPVNTYQRLTIPTESYHQIHPCKRHLVHIQQSYCPISIICIASDLSKLGGRFWATGSSVAAAKAPFACGICGRVKGTGPRSDTAHNFRTLKYDYAVTGLQFDIAAMGENLIEIYNWPSMQHSTQQTGT